MPSDARKRRPADEDAPDAPPEGEGEGKGRKGARRKASGRSATRKKASRKKATRKKTTRKKTTQKKTARNKATRKKASGRKKAGRKASERAGDGRRRAEGDEAEPRREDDAPAAGAAEGAAAGPEAGADEAGPEPEAGAEEAAPAPSRRSRRGGRGGRGRGRRRRGGARDDDAAPSSKDAGAGNEGGAGKEGEAAVDPAALLARVREGTASIDALDRLSDAELAELARSEGETPADGERRSETIFRLVKRPVDPDELPSDFVEGLLELHPDGYGFLRRPDHGYVQHPEDVYVSAGLIRKVGLQAGHWVAGQARPGKPGERLLALFRVEEVGHEPPERLADLTAFDELTVVYPDERFLLEVRPEDVEMRILDLFCPLGRGQRGIITAPPRTGKTVLLQKLADSIAHNSPNVDIVVLLVDERPEEVTNMRRSVRGEVIASTFDRPAANHVRVAELVMEKVKRMVEMGRHVVLLLDSITRLGRAYNNMAGPSGRILTGGLDAKALTKPKRFFGAARNVEDGGSLTILATALIQTGSRMDDVIFEEFKGTGNMEIVLDRDIANARVWPAINIPSSGTRNEDLLLHPEEMRRINLIRKAMTGMAPQEAVLMMRDRMKEYATNAELLMSLD